MSRARGGSEKSFASSAACVPESSLVHRSLPSFLCRRMAWMVVGRGGGRRVPSLFLEGMRAVCVCVCAFVGKIFADVWSTCGRLICFPHWKELVNFLVLYRRHLFSPLRFLVRVLCLIARPDMDGPSSSSLRRRGEGVVVCTAYAGGLLKERPHLHFSHAERIGGTKWQQFISGEISTVNFNMLSRVAKEQCSYLCYFARLIFSKSESKRYFRFMRERLSERRA